MSSGADKVKYNYLFNLIYQIVNALVQIILLRYLSIVIGSEGVGIQSYTNSVVSYFTMIMALGINWYGQMEIAKKAETRQGLSRCFRDLIVLKFFWGMLIMPLYVLLIIISEAYRIYYIAYAVMLIATIIDISWFYQGIERFDIVSVRNIIIKLLGMLLIMVFVKEKDDVLKYILILSLSTLAGNLSIWCKLYKEISLHGLDKVQYGDVKIHFRNALRYFIPTIAITIYTTLDKTMLGVIGKNPKENGYYEQAVQVASMLKIIVLSYNSVMMSRMTCVIARNQKERMKELFDGSLSFTAFICWPIMVGFAVLERDFCFLYFGAEYSETANILFLFSPIIFIIGLSNLVENHIVTPMNLRSLGNRVVIWGLIANIILNSAFIPLWGGIGAAAASVISEIIVTINYIKPFPDLINGKKIIVFCFKNAISSGIMCIFLIILKSKLEVGVIALCTEIILGAAVYFCMLCLLRDRYTIGILHLVKEMVTTHLEK